ncbi:hypothetical protein YASMINEVIRUS_248 [Yasminevirus sp. GU-2018]|uniref:Uncharacterized protein n=1 Tax=Yasminevirus sp. GU-2018 TaxID=2420051 RepID=A0A5K0U7N5_9VIRU|nr:hypothetical protein YASMINEVIRUS_248 [Yasminevirus sp. GU-2018]
MNRTGRKTKKGNDMAINKDKVEAKAEGTGYDSDHSTVIKYEESGRILLRKKVLFEKLCDNKLEYVKDGVCDSFIKYGTPSLDTVIQDIQQKTDIKSKRLTRLLKRLRKEGEPYDEKVSYYAKYIKNGGDLDYHVSEGIKEWFYLNKTEYPELLKIYKDEDKAQAKAFNNYIKKNGTDKYTERIRQTEMVIRLH